MQTLPLDGLTVVSIEQAVAAPFATRQLADLGARVIKIEREAGDFARHYDSKVSGESSYFIWLNRSKESIVLDLKSEDDLAIVRQLTDQADVFIQNLAPGAVEKLGLGAEDLQATNPKLIYVSISGYGVGGQMELKKAYDLLIQCEAGLLSVTGTPDDVSKVGISIADIASGMYAYTGILSALLLRAKTGRGDVIEVSMLEALAEWMQQPELYTRYGGAQPPRTGANHATIGPYGPYKTADGWAFLGIQNEREWAVFCNQVLGDGSLATNALFANNTLRVQNGNRLRIEIETVFSGINTMEVLTRLDSANIANAALRDLAGLSAHPQLLARNRWIHVPTPTGDVSMLKPPVTSRDQAFHLSPVPGLGEHSEKIRQELQQHSHQTKQSND